MAQLSADCFAHGGKLMSLDDALALIEERTTVVAGVEAIALRDALGRILAEDLVAPFAVPPHANSAVDGYAIRFDDLSADSDTALRLAGRAAAGHPEGHALQSGEAIRVFTGAVMKVRNTSFSTVPSMPLHLSTQCGSRPERRCAFSSELAAQIIRRPFT